VLFLIALLFGCVVVVRAHPQPAVNQGKLADGEPDQSYNKQEEAFIRTPPGFERAGQRKQAVGAETATLQVTIVEHATDRPTPCRVNVIGPDSNYYEPQKNPLEPFNAQNTGCHRNGETHAPSRYYGWYFYTTGEFEVHVPAGDVRIEVWKGYEYRPVEKTVHIAAASRKSVEIELRRTAPMHELDYYSGDTHIHLNRRNEEEEELALDLMEAEDIGYGHILCMNDPATYSGGMERQEWPQHQGFGPSSVRTRGIYGIASAQEYRSKKYGHICLLMHDGLVLEGATVNPNNWPVFGVVGKMTRQLGGYSFHAHGGYSLEIYADYVQQATDGVELLQMAHYRGIGLSGWYRILNIGYRFPALSGSDFPYTRALGDCRTYVYSKVRPNFSEWAGQAAEGRSFFTTGPLLLLEVDGKHPGDIINLKGSQPKQLNVQLQVRCEVTPIQHLDLIVNGNTAQRWTIPHGDGNKGTWHKRQFEIAVEEPSWIAARAYGISRTRRSDAEAHTNPVYVYREESTPFQAVDLDWLVERLERQIDALKQRSFPEKEQALGFFQESHRRLLEMRP